MNIDEADNEVLRRRMCAALAELADILRIMAENTPEEHPELRERILDEMARMAATQRRAAGIDLLPH